MSRATVIIRCKADREKLTNWIAKAPDLTRVELKAPKRSIPQNDRMWAMLTDIAQQKDYHGIKLTPDDWKLLFLDALKREVRMVPNLDSTGFISLGRSSSDLSREEMKDLMTVIEAWGVQNGITFNSPTEGNE